MKTKDELRAEARLLRARLTRLQPHFADCIAHFAGNTALAPGAKVASYWPIRDEADPRLFASELARRGHLLLLPAATAYGKPLAFRLWREGVRLRKNGHGFHEPCAEAEVSEPDVVLVPLLAFDSQGFRLGYGGGHYDITLARLRARRAIVAIGIAYAGQEVPQLPHDPHDQPLDMVVTERGVTDFRRSAR